MAFVVRQLVARISFALLPIATVFYPTAVLASAEGSINADDLVTINGIPWAAKGWPFSKVLETQRDSIDSTIVGRVVLDRHGEDSEPEYGILRDPFASPKPGRVIVVSNWGSNNSGCFVEMILQVATRDDQTVDPKSIVPTQLDMMINKQRVTLKAVDAPGIDRYGSFKYKYTKSVKRGEKMVSVTLDGVWSLSRHLFAVNASQAKLLSSAPSQKMPVRMTLANRSPVTIPIGKGTVERWPSVYGFNSACKAKRG